jgi:hypothetical protein
VVDAGGVSEGQLLADARRGDRTAFELLVRRHRDELYGSYRMLGSVQDAEDAVQEALPTRWSVATHEAAGHLRLVGCPEPLRTQRRATIHATKADRQFASRSQGCASAWHTRWAHATGA